jgi:hypothetical protein
VDVFGSRLSGLAGPAIAPSHEGQEASAELLGSAGWTAKDAAAARNAALVVTTPGEPVEALGAVPGWVAKG